MRFINKFFEHRMKDYSRGDYLIIVYLSLVMGWVLNDLFAISLYIVFVINVALITAYISKCLTK